MRIGPEIEVSVAVFEDSDFGYFLVVPIMWVQPEAENWV